MKIRLLADDYKHNKQIYKDFVANEIDFSKDYFSDSDHLMIDAAPDFPIYMADYKGEEKINEYFKAINILNDYYINTPRDIHMNERFWHSLLIGYKRDYIVEKYPKVLDNEKEFNKVVLRDYDWENYIYKCVLLTEYVKDFDWEYKGQKEIFIRTIVDSGDLFNYIFKTKLFKNYNLIVNFILIIYEEGIAKQMREKVKHPAVTKDERYGRLVIKEINLSYPVIMAPALDKEELKELVVKTLEDKHNQYDTNNENI